MAEDTADERKANSTTRPYACERVPKIVNTDGWSVLTRATLPGASSWSHQYGNAANTSSIFKHGTPPE